jgi:hypothetical protein
MTGRAAGYCAGYDTPGYANPRGRRGLRGHGGYGGRGWRHQYYATGLPGWARAGSYPPALMPRVPSYRGAPPQMTREDTVAALKEEAEYLKEALGDVQKRLGDLESEAGE